MKRYDIFYSKNTDENNLKILLNKLFTFLLYQLRMMVSEKPDNIMTLT